MIKFDEILSIGVVSLFVTGYMKMSNTIKSLTGKMDKEKCNYIHVELSKDLTEIKESLARIEERTKKL